MWLDFLLTWEGRRPPGLMGLLRHHPSQEATMVSIPHALNRIKAHLADALPEATLRRISTDLDLRSPQRTLPPVVTTSLFLQQILHGNPAICALRPLSGRDFTDSAYHSGASR